MLHVVATGVATGNRRVTLTSRSAAIGIGKSQDGMARGIRDLARFIQAEIRSRQLTLFELSEDWFDPQMRLAISWPENYPQEFLCLEKPGTSAWETQAELWKK